LGIGYGLLTALCYAGYILFLQRARRDDYSGSSAVDLGLLSLVSALLLCAMALGAGESLAISAPRDAVLLAAYGLVAQVIGAFLIAGSLATLPAATVGLVLLLQPLMSFVWDIVLFSRPFTGLEITGAAVALGAIYAGSRWAPARGRRDDKISAPEH
jgi:drug/metabolite transporter (DMT)-like permease